MKRWQEILLQTVLWITVVPAMLIVGALVLGTILDGVTQYDEDRDRCLKHADNGYDIQRCR